MNPHLFHGWLLDLYLDQEDGLSLWFIDQETDERVRIKQPFPVQFFATGQNEQLRALWKELRKRPCVILL